MEVVRVYLCVYVVKSVVFVCVCVCTWVESVVFCVCVCQVCCLRVGVGVCM